MLSKPLWDEVVDNAAKSWAERLTSPALFFWGVGVFVFGHHIGWKSIQASMSGLTDFAAVGLIVGVVLLIAASSKIIEEMQHVPLGLLRGDWPRAFHPLRRKLVLGALHEWSIKRARLATLMEHYDHLTPEEELEYAQLDDVLKNDYPALHRFHPTRIGNRLQSAEDYPSMRYGLVASVIWPRLWLVIPDEARSEIVSTRERLTSGVRLMTWSCLLLSWLPLTIWWIAWWTAIPIVLAVSMGTMWGYWQTLRSARDYGDLLRAAFDVYRIELFESIGWSTIQDTVRVGEQLTSFLWRGELPT